MEQCALPHARGADDGDHLALRDVEVEAAKDFQAAARRRVRLDELAHFDKRHYWFRKASAGSIRPAWRDGYTVARRHTADGRHHHDRDVEWAPQGTGDA